MGLTRSTAISNERFGALHPTDPSASLNRTSRLRSRLHSCLTYVHLFGLIDEVALANRQKLTAA